MPKRRDFESMSDEELAAHAVERTRDDSLVSELALRVEVSADYDTALDALEQLARADRSPRVRVDAIEALTKCSRLNPCHALSLAAELLGTETSREPRIAWFGLIEAAAAQGGDRSEAARTILDVWTRIRGDARTAADLAFGRLAVYPASQ